MASGVLQCNCYSSIVAVQQLLFSWNGVNIVGAHPLSRVHPRKKKKSSRLGAVIVAPRYPEHSTWDKEVVKQVGPTQYESFYLASVIG